MNEEKPVPVEADEDFLTEPLAGLTATPLHLMSEEELRQRVLATRQLRQSFQTFKSEVEKGATEKKSKAEVGPNKVLGGLEDLL